MKDRRKMHRDAYPQYAPGYAPKITLVFCVLFLVIGALFFGYRYYVMRQQAQESIKKPVGIQQEVHPDTGIVPTHYLVVRAIPFKGVQI